MLSPQPFRKHLAKELRNARVLLGSPDTRLARDVLRKGDGHIPHDMILVQHGFRVKKNPIAVAGEKDGRSFDRIDPALHACASS